MKASQRYQWPSWVVYDQNFRQEAAGNPHQSRARMDLSIYAQCFMSQAISWCTRCQCLDHTTSNCPYRPKKQWSSTGGSSNSSSQGKSSRFASSASLTGTASLGKNGGTSTYAVRAESPIPSHVVVQGKQWCRQPVKD